MRTCEDKVEKILSTLPVNNFLMNVCIYAYVYVCVCVCKRLWIWVEMCFWVKKKFSKMRVERKPYKLADFLEISGRTKGKISFRWSFSGNLRKSTSLSLSLSLRIWENKWILPLFFAMCVCLFLHSYRNTCMRESQPSHVIWSSHLYGRGSDLQCTSVSLLLPMPVEWSCYCDYLVQVHMFAACIEIAAAVAKGQEKKRTTKRERERERDRKTEKHKIQVGFA